MHLLVCSRSLVQWTGDACQPTKSVSEGVRKSLLLSRICIWQTLVVYGLLLSMSFSNATLMASIVACILPWHLHTKVVWKCKISSCYKLKILQLMENVMEKEKRSLNAETARMSNILYEMKIEWNQQRFWRQTQNIIIAKHMKNPTFVWIELKKAKKLLGFVFFKKAKSRCKMNSLNFTRECSVTSFAFGHMFRICGKHYNHCMLSSPEKRIYFHLAYAQWSLWAKMTMLFLRVHLLCVFTCDCASFKQFHRGNRQFHEIIVSAENWAHFYWRDFVDKYFACMKKVIQSEFRILNDYFNTLFTPWTVCMRYPSSSKRWRTNSNVFFSSQKLNKYCVYCETVYHCNCALWLYTQ